MFLSLVELDEHPWVTDEQSKKNIRFIIISRSLFREIGCPVNTPACFLTGWTFTDVICIWPLNFHLPWQHSRTRFFFSSLRISSEPFQKLGDRSSLNLCVPCFSDVHMLVSFHNYYIFQLLYHSDLHSPPRLCHFSLNLPSFSPPFMSPASDDPAADWWVFADCYTGCNNTGLHPTNPYPRLQMVGLCNWTFASQLILFKGCSKDIHNICRLRKRDSTLFINNI